MISNYIRKSISRYFTGQKEITFKKEIPGMPQLEKNFRELDELGIYLHIPFCKQICPYCPYNKEIYKEEAAAAYVGAVKKEIDQYAYLVGGTPITNFYIGGGTPTALLGGDIETIIDHLYLRFNMQCKIHMESHPNDLSPENLDRIETLGVKYLSIGIEALQDRHLKAIKRPYTVQEAKEAVGRVTARNFECVNLDYMFDLPDQNQEEIEDACRQMIDLGIQQVATYPLFRFTYTRLKGGQKKSALATMFRRRKYLKAIENQFYPAGFERSSVWAFTRKGIPKYCSVTIPAYLGLGASGASYLNDTFYVNTFRVKEYIKAMETGEFPIALSIDLSKKMQMSAWLYWRIYETKFRKCDFQRRFQVDFDQQYGRQIEFLSRMGWVSNGNDLITLTDKGSYWIHAFEDFFSIDYINKLWGTSKTTPWPEEVIL